MASADISVKLEMDADDRALIERQCDVMEGLTALLKQHLSQQCESESQKIKEVMIRTTAAPKTAGSYSEMPAPTESG